MKKRDLSTIIGLMMGGVAIIVGMALNNGKFDFGCLKLFWDIPSIFITVGGSFFTIMISFPMEILKRLPITLKNAFLDKMILPNEIIEKFVEISKKARKEGLLSLEDEIEKIDDDFLKSGIQMVVDGIEHESIQEILEMKISSMEKRHTDEINLLKAWAGYGPAYGMIGTLIGLVQMLASLNDPGALGPGMSKAIITSFYGSVMANFIFGPLANKLETKTAEESYLKEMMLVGVLSIQEGVNPRIIEDKLKTYLSPEQRLKLVKEELQKDTVLENE